MHSTIRREGAFNVDFTLKRRGVKIPLVLKVPENAKIKVAVSVDKQHTLVRIYMEKYISV